jgi:hypothetical protein
VKDFFILEEGVGAGAQVEDSRKVAGIGWEPIPEVMTFYEVAVTFLEPVGAFGRSGKVIH